MATITCNAYVEKYQLSCLVSMSFILNYEAILENSFPSWKEKQDGYFIYLQVLFIMNVEASQIQVLWLHACVLSCIWLFSTPWTVCSPPGSFARGIFQARILESVAISSSRGSSRTRDQTWVFLHWQADSLSLCHLAMYISCIFHTIKVWRVITVCGSLFKRPYPLLQIHIKILADNLMMTYRTGLK
jgi:hypothetical protein